ncbi:MAG: aminoacyl-tRNA hydrolase [Bacteroidaceae bacterium]|nr:aminoacyl-tRNA hydrolase [Bacteroidaceae bacterium]
MKYLIVGLGNIGPEYDGTRHNIGFRVLDALSKASNTAFEDRRYGFVAHMRVKNAELVLLKPSTYMNLSGNAVRYWLLQEKIPVENMLVVVDDLSLPLGAIRLRQGGGDAGHNGLKHIAQTLGGQGYNRLRFGIGSDFPQGCQVDFVLSKFTPEEEQLVNERALVACDAIKAFALSGMQFAMCNYNNK